MTSHECAQSISDSIGSARSSVRARGVEGPIVDDSTTGDSDDARGARSLVTLAIVSTANKKGERRTGMVTSLLQREGRTTKCRVGASSRLRRGTWIAEVAMEVS
jgi:hypothetical protein